MAVTKSGSGSGPTAGPVGRFCSPQEATAEAFSDYEVLPSESEQKVSL